MNEIIILILIYYFISILFFIIITYKKTAISKNVNNSNTLNNIFINELNERLI